ncbi:UNVERIFIED_CONTAM: hypothetical protein GTU68_012388, partial [Idotea baltica]|nr:hypothetical protein [Idotea baltica]
MRKSKPFIKELHLTNPPYESYNQGCFWNLVDVLKSSILPFFIISSLSLLIVLVSFLDNRLALAKLEEPPCFDKCRMVLVESIPENLTYPEGSPVFPSTYHAWKSLLKDATKSIDLAVFYWSLKNEDVTPIKMHSAWQGEDVLQDLLRIGKSTDVKIRVAQNAPTKQQPQNDSKLLEQEGAAEVRSLDFNRLVGAGVLHTKMWIVDGKHLYLGSANMDWQSLTQVKETGIWIQNCSCLAQDMMKVF